MTTSTLSAPLKFWSVDEVIEVRVKSDPILSSRRVKQAEDSSKMKNVYRKRRNI